MWSNMTLEQKKRFWKFLFMDDIQFYEEFIAGLPLEAQERFFTETPDFMSDYLGKGKKVKLEDDEVYQKIMQKIRRLKENT